MKSLQVLTPHIECIYNCPFCISKTHAHDNLFMDNYSFNYELWRNNLIEVIKNNKDLGYVVITGTNEPMQSKECVRDIIDIVRLVNDKIQIEIQTHYYKEDEVYNNLDVVAYSISNVDAIKAIKPMGKIQRFVFLLTDSFNGYTLGDLLSIIPHTVKQITFKVLHDSNGVNHKIDDYIRNNKTEKRTYNKLRRDILQYSGNLSIRLDEDCMDSDNRYKIFREDGLVYNNWEEK